MKKLFAAVLAAMLALCAGAAGAEVYTAAQLKADPALYEGQLPEGAADTDEFVGLYGLLFPRGAAVIDFGSVKIKDTAELEEGLSQFPALEEVDMYESSLSREQMASLAEKYPALHFGWTLKVGSYKVRTDTTAFSSLHSPQNTHYPTSHYEILKYCWQIEALDLGHNKLTDISFIGTMKNLKLLILADNQIKDISPLKDLKQLEYVELFMNKIADLSPLEGMENLLDLNLCYNRMDDMSAVYTMPKLERLWVSHNKLSKETMNEMKEKLPDTHICFSSSGSTDQGWRKHERYYVIKNVFDNWSYRPFEEAAE